MRPLLLISLALSLTVSRAQPPVFRSLTTAQGLNDGVIRSFAQDKYGYIWVGTQSGLNRYDGYRIRQFLSAPGDSASVYPGEVNSGFCAPDGQMYFGFNQGLLRYDYAGDRFIRLRAERAFGVGAMLSDGREAFWMATTAGLARVHTATGRIRFLQDEVRDSAQWSFSRHGLGDLERTPGGTLLATSRQGLLVYRPQSARLRLVTVPGLESQFFTNVEVATDGTVWLSCRNIPKLIRTDTGFTRFEVFNYVQPDRKALSNAVASLLVDRSNRLWVTTIPDGLCLFEPETNRFIRFVNDPLRPASIGANLLTAAFEDRSGMIWLGTEGYGVQYFHPDRNIFDVLVPQPPGDRAAGWIWARSASEDERGMLWLATGGGVVQYHPRKGALRSFANRGRADSQLYSNSVRGILCESDSVWIITGGGVHRFRQRTGQMDRLADRQGLPRAFYFTAFKDSRGTLWIGGRDGAGLYYRTGRDRFVSVDHHPILRPIAGFGVRTIFQDREGRIWFGLNGSGLACYDDRAATLRHWKSREADSTSLTGDLVTGIAQDSRGRIWISTTSGVARWDSGDRFRQFHHKNGMPSVRTASIMVDRRDRIWAGTTYGLALFDEKGGRWKLFNENAGLPAAEFTDMPASRLKDGRFVFPTLKGFVLLDPERYTESIQQPDCYVSGIRILNQPAGSLQPFEELHTVELSPEQNFFSIELTALHYDDPGATWYAYQLEGFDNSWVYTRDRLVNYTNVPGGSYRFRYKATTDPSNWNVPEKELRVHVATVFYKTALFRIFVALLLMAAGYGAYRLRMNKQRQILQLETKARELEKEKTQVKYESLKQQLNPHFLFNSLTSLRSLIRTDTKHATQFLDGLSKVYRYVLRSGERELIQLSEELEFVRHFVALQKTRFRDGLEVCIEAGPEWHERYLVPVTVQNLVENAIKHNTADPDRPLRIRIALEGEMLVVANNLQRYPQVESSNNKGLSELRSLYGFYTPRPVEVIETTEQFIVKIPLL